MTGACTVLTAVACAGLASAAALVPAPPPALVVAVAVSIVLPMMAAWECSASFALLPPRRSQAPLDEAAFEKLRRELDLLPETGHPLDG